MHGERSEGTPSRRPWDPLVGPYTKGTGPGSNCQEAVRAPPARTPGPRQLSFLGGKAPCPTFFPSRNVNDLPFAQ